MSETPPGAVKLAADRVPPGAVPLPPRGQPIDESATGILTGAVRDLAPGPGGRPGKVSISENRPGNKTPLGVTINPQNAGESLIQPAIMTPAYALMPGGAVGRIALAAGVGGGSEAARGGTVSSSMWRTLLDGAVAGLTEGAGAYVASKAEKAAKPLLDATKDNQAAQAAFKHASEAPQKALDFIRNRLPSGKWLSVPSLGQAKVTAQEAIDALGKMEGDAYRVAREEVIANLDKLDIRKAAKLAPYAGRVFRMLTSDARFTPPPMPKGSVAQRGARAMMDATQNPAARGAADAATTGPLPGDAASRGSLVAAGALDEGGERFHQLLRHFMPAH